MMHATNSDDGDWGFPVTIEDAHSDDSDDDEDEDCLLSPVSTISSPPNSTRSLAVVASDLGTDDSSSDP